nr:MAG TPA: hypothetical protein [Caudoviricetes sp.]
MEEKRRKLTCFVKYYKVADAEIEKAPPVRQHRER